VSLVQNQAPRHGDVWGSRDIAPDILNFINGRRRVVTFASRPLYLRGKSPGTLLIGDWVDLRDPEPVCAEEKNHALQRVEPLLSDT
jgi:hypothetical protein